MALLWKYICVLFPGGILAGIASSVAGIASLFSYPALLLVGIPPVFANVTNTVALVSSAVGSGISSRRELHGHKRELLRLLPLTVGGSLCGGVLLLVAPAASFKKVVPFFIYAAAVLILRPGLLHFGAQGHTDAADTNKAALAAKKRAAVIFNIVVFLVGAYTGYFGAAGGVVMLALLAATSTAEFAEYNALKNVSLGASNLVAAILFVFRSHVYWLAALPLAIGFFIGGAIGPCIVRRIPAGLLRNVIAVGAIVLATVLFFQAYFR